MTSTSLKNHALSLLAVAMTLVTSLASAATPASDSRTGKALEFEDIAIQVVGKGTPVLMVPGLNSAGTVWTQTCEALQASKVQCHIVHLPGFAGRPAVPGEAFTSEMSTRLLRYLDHAKLEQPVVMGHSLGGVIGMQMAVAQPDRLHKLIIVDSLPFFAAAGNPAVTEAQAQAMAKGMREGMLAADEESYYKQAEMALTNMSNQPERMDTLRKWGRSSDRATTALAMSELMGQDLRDDVAKIRTPTLLLAAWAGFADFGATRESIGKVFADQYDALPGIRIELSEGGYHFLMWDDQQWLVNHVSGFIKSES